MQSVRPVSSGKQKSPGEEAQVLFACAYAYLIKSSDLYNTFPEACTCTHSEVYDQAYARHKCEV